MSRTKRGVDGAAPYIFLSPWFIGFLLFSGMPILASFVISCMKWDLLGEPEWVGIANYANLFEPGSGFYKTLQATLIFTLVNVLVTVLGSLGLAVLLNLKVRFIGVFRFVYFLPMVIPVVVLAATMSLIFDPNLGVANYLLGRVGIEGPNWMADPVGIWMVVGLMSLFSFGTGQMMLIFTTGIKEVPQELVEAAALDGANAWHRFLNVTVPSISPLILFNLVIATVGSFNGAFTIIYPLSEGGPGDVTRVLSLDIYKTVFQKFDLGTGSAMAMVLFVIVAAISALQFKLSQRHVSYG
ncbi:MAG: sugar ABC transporter permease [Bifidobacteriaceae bacterium]|jgi:multiple sugar transport system permease protein|nr:sugar ABC transporter permease [Bifidobacteriaceae bacterium]